MKPRLPLQISALLVIVLTNAVALGGALWNRSGEAESQLTLSQRELRLPYRSFDRENSGLALALSWRVIGPPDRTGIYWEYAGGGTPEWLDKAKMESLGFDMAERAPGGDRRSGRMELARDVLLVLEFDGDAYQRSLERARQHLAAEETKLVAMPDSNEKKNRLKNAADQLAREENENSRLFVVDAGRDRAALRARHPDRTRYAIVRGQVRPSWSGEQTERHGHVSNISISGINVPHALKPLLAESARQQKFTAGVAFGQRLEPWITQLEVATR